MEYKASKKEQKNTGKRRVLVHGRSWLKWIALFVILLSVLHIFSNPDSWTGPIVLTVSIGLFFLFKRARKIQFDDENLYIIRDKREKIIPFTAVVSIKRSATKVNGERFWKLKYEDETKQRTLRYFRSFFNKEFHTAVKKANPAVVIWTHPHFNH